MTNKTISINDCWNTIGVWGDQSPRCSRLKEIIHCHNCEIYSQAGSQLLDRKTEDSYLLEWRNNLCEPRKEDNLDSVSALVFRMGDEWFALESKLVNEITHCDKHHTLPHVNNKILRGLVNVNGELVLNISLGFLFKIDKGVEKNKNTRERYIIISDGEENFAFPVTEVKEIIHYNNHNIETTPSTINNDSSCFIKGILQYNDIDIGIIDSDLVFSALHKNI